jgi:hypothetical protein
MSDDLDIRLRDLLAERGRLEGGSVELVLGSIDQLPARRAGRPWSSLLAVAAVIVLALVGVAILAQVRGRGDVATTPTASPTSSITASPSATVVTPSPSGPAVIARPVWAIDLASHLDCDGPPSTMGMDVPDVPSPFDPGATPEEALTNILIDYRSLPSTGWTRPFIDGRWAVQRYLVNDRVKVHVVSTNLFPDAPTETRWQVVGLRACDPSEFDIVDIGNGAPTVWRDAADVPVRTEVVVSSPGPGHCGWQRTVFLTLGPDKAQYFRDPHGDLAEYSVVPFDPDANLPADAVDTGFHTDEWHLYTIPSGRAVFIRTKDGTVERWPRATEPIGCA